MKEVFLRNQLNPLCRGLGVVVFFGSFSLRQRNEQALRALPFLGDVSTTLDMTGWDRDDKGTVLGEDNDIFCRKYLFISVISVTFAGVNLK